MNEQLQFVTLRNVKLDINIGKYCLITRSKSPHLMEERFMQLNRLMLSCTVLIVIIWTKYLISFAVIRKLLRNPLGGCKKAQSVSFQNWWRHKFIFMLRYNPLFDMFFFCFVFVKSIKTIIILKRTFSLYHGNKCKQLFLVVFFHPQHFFWKTLFCCHSKSWHNMQRYGIFLFLAARRTEERFRIMPINSWTKLL